MAKAEVIKQKRRSELSSSMEQQVTTHLCGINGQMT